MVMESYKPEERIIELGNEIELGARREILDENNSLTRAEKIAALALVNMGCFGLGGKSVLAREIVRQQAEVVNSTFLGDQRTVNRLAINHLLADGVKYVDELLLAPQTDFSEIGFLTAASLNMLLFQKTTSEPGIDNFILQQIITGVRSALDKGSSRGNVPYEQGLCALALVYRKYPNLMSDPEWKELASRVSNSRKLQAKGEL